MKLSRSSKTLPSVLDSFPIWLLNFQVEVIELVNNGSGLGFGIIGGQQAGVIVKTILPDGVADRDGRLKPNDFILQVKPFSRVVFIVLLSTTISSHFKKKWMQPMTSLITG